MWQKSFWHSYRLKQANKFFYQCIFPNICYYLIFFFKYYYYLIKINVLKYIILSFYRKSFIMVPGPWWYQEIYRWVAYQCFWQFSKAINTRLTIIAPDALRDSTYCQDITTNSSLRQYKNFGSSILMRRSSMQIISNPFPIFSGFRNVTVSFKID